MHDVAVIQGIADAVAEKLKGKRIKEMQLEIAIGALRFVEEEHAQFWLDELLKKEFGPDLKLKINLETIKPAIRCSCGFSGQVDSFKTTHEMAHQGVFEMHCPKCNSEEFELLHGKECLVKELEWKEK